MIKANELRVNNHLQKYLGPQINEWIDVKITAADILDISVNNNHGFRPIPLTEERLLELGFYTDNESNDFYDKLYVLNRFGERVYFADGSIILGWEGYYDHHSEAGYCEHVHQLQNLYFSLTGEELTFKK